MQKDINIDSVKQYNASLKQYKDASSKLSAEIEFTEKELKSLCEQLTRDLGVEVTLDNIDKIYEEQVEKINQALETGTAILSKIEQEANSGVSSYKTTTFNNGMMGNIPNQVQSSNTVFNNGTPLFSL